MADKFRHDDNTYTVYCEECDQPFTAVRYDAKFCSPRCRVANARRPQKFKHALEDIEQMKRTLRGYAYKYEKSSSMESAFTELYKALGELLSVFCVEVLDTDKCNEQPVTHRRF